MKPGSDCITWSWERQEVRIGYDRLGVGPVVLLLPALSSISTRREMRPRQERLVSDFATVAIDWPGFGDKPRPPIPWQPAAVRQFETAGTTRPSRFCRTDCPRALLTGQPIASGSD